MELHQIRYFLAVADTMNFTRASERACISQPALTKAIQRLEETIGGRLFDRARNPVQLTELGRAMMPNLRQVYDSAQQAHAQARRLTAGTGERVRVGVMCSIDFNRLLPACADVQQGRQEVLVSFCEGNLDSLGDALGFGELDLCIVSTPDALPRRFSAQLLFNEPFVVAFGDDHRFNGRSHVELKELHRERCCERAMCEHAAPIERLLRERGVELDVVQASAREDWVQALVRANCGVAFMPLSLARSAGLAHVAAADAEIVRQVMLLHLADRALSPAQLAVVGSLMAQNWGAEGLQIRN